MGGIKWIAVAVWALCAVSSHGYAFQGNSPADFPYADYSSLLQSHPTAFPSCVSEHLLLSYDIPPCDAHPDFSPDMLDGPNCRAEYYSVAEAAHVIQRALDKAVACNAEKQNPRDASYWRCSKFQELVSKYTCKTFEHGTPVRMVMMSGISAATFNEVGRECMGESYAPLSEANTYNTLTCSPDRLNGGSPPYIQDTFDIYSLELIAEPSALQVSVPDLSDDEKRERHAYYVEAIALYRGQEAWLREKADRMLQLTDVYAVNAFGVNSNSPMYYLILDMMTSWPNAEYSAASDHRKTLANQLEAGKSELENYYPNFAWTSTMSSRLVTLGGRASARTDDVGCTMEEPKCKGHRYIYNTKIREGCIFICIAEICAEQIGSACRNVTVEKGMSIPDCQRYANQRDKCYGDVQHLVPLN
mmetsp:Transcript_11863/g.36167  ORF Transcript_11863/g.36167 Transcript_11863/m.36167 type:complete len:416 (+) Transcript_11863:843-2090(+)|eukprot:CAMPEP_0198725806 /NCGR_PEP_ID=MMETSP1475-20131203/3035_1 /TAXON_ID= ORGANISM="Unidentified sp., Strain CCMP1999" /NCGR_SAMPLE_ID=MMETSP1475 /ASSEMBLY_ACC=CAM_ASM_001111 /LENGTH=415 /DNA_ID=CAMNT_0044487641 /DNA_START=720 /DNA_END=1967 /DNA_ORIENTATION=-